jgi:phage shock protein C
MNHPMHPPKRMTRSRDDKIVAGVCGGLARYLNMDPALVRILTVVATLLTSGAALLVYVVAIMVMPEEEPVGPPSPGPAPAWPPQPSGGPAPAPHDPVWGREGAPWEQPPAGTPQPPTPGGPASEGQAPDAR